MGTTESTPVDGEKQMMSCIQTAWPRAWHQVTIKKMAINMCEFLLCFFFNFVSFIIMCAVWWSCAWCMCAEVREQLVNMNS